MDIDNKREQLNNFPLTNTVKVHIDRVITLRHVITFRQVITSLISILRQEKNMPLKGLVDSITLFYYK